MQREVSKGFTAQRCRPDSVTISDAPLWSCRCLKYAKVWQEREGRGRLERRRRRLEGEGGKGQKETGGETKREARKDGAKRRDAEGGGEGQRGRANQQEKGGMMGGYR